MSAWQTEYRHDSYADRDDIHDRPNLASEMNTEDGVVYQGRDAKNPTPALHLVRESMECQEPEYANAHPAQEDVVSVWILRVESPEKHCAGDCLWNPDSFHLSCRTSAFWGLATCGEYPATHCSILFQSVQ